MRCHSRDTVMPSRRFVCAAVCKYLLKYNKYHFGLNQVIRLMVENVERILILFFKV